MVGHLDGLRSQRKKASIFDKSNEKKKNKKSVFVLGLEKGLSLFFDKRVDVFFFFVDTSKIRTAEERYIPSRIPLPFLFVADSLRGHRPALPCRVQ